jgi:GPH family glycoside/pentoside/hexuronide:cation symporter
MIYKASPNEGSGKIPIIRKAAWGLGGFPSEMVNAVMGIGVLVYSMHLGVSATLIGVALALPRLWDAIADPLMGRISDTTRSRWGRRKPYIVIGGVGVGVFYFLMWCPSAEWSENTLLIYFIIISFLFFTFFTIFNIPWQAMGFEMTEDVKERNSIQAIRALFASIAALVIGYILPVSEYFGQGDAIAGLKLTSLVVAVVLILCALASIFVKEPALSFIPAPNKSQKKDKIALLKPTVETLANKHFRRLCIFIVFMLIGVILVGPMGNYINAYYVFGALPYEEALSKTQLMMGHGGFIATVAALCGIPLFTLSANRFGKKRTLLWGVVFLTLIHLCNWFGYNPNYPYLQLVLAAFNKIALTLPWVIVPSMIADICSQDELENNIRREATFAAVFGLCIKIAATLAVALSGYLVNLCGIVDAAAVQNTDSILYTRILFAVVPAAFILFGGCFLINYSLDDQKAMEVQAALKKQRAHEVEQAS